MGMIPSGAVQLFTDKTETVSETVTPFNRGEV